MDFIRGSDFRPKSSAVAFGRFDGLHAGHRAVLGRLEGLKREGLATVLLSFDYRPCGLFGAGDVLYSEEEKARLLKGSGLDAMVSLPFDDSLARMGAEDFVKEHLVRRLGAKTVVAGSACRFGKDLEGDIGTLRALGSRYGFDVVECAQAMSDGAAIDAERVRAAFGSGDLAKANELLGQPFTIFGEVVHGKALGRTVGMPTANLKAHADKFMPNHGVYGTLSDIDGDIVQGLTNIGRRPSVDDHSYVTIETFLLDFSKDIYGRQIALELHAFIRGVLKFDSLDAVKKQVGLDIESIRNRLDALCVR